MSGFGLKKLILYVNFYFDSSCFINIAYLYLSELLITINLITLTFLSSDSILSIFLKYIILFCASILYAIR